MRARACVLLVLLASCDSKNGDNQGVDAGIELPYENTVVGDFDPQALATAIAGATCAYYQRCIPAAFPVFGYDNASCVADNIPPLQRTYQVLSPVIAAGRARFHKTLFDQCVAEFATVDCTLGPEPTSPCNGVVEGLQTAGAACFLNGECAPNKYCQRPMGTGTCGTCANAAANGADCSTTNFECESGSTCAGAGNELRCVPTNAAENAVCGDVNSGLCRGILECVGPSTAAGQCQRPIETANTACDPSLIDAPDCNGRRNFICLDGLCASVVSYGDIGAACGGAMDCKEGGFCPSATGGQCTAFPVADQACLGADRLCADGFYCRGQTCAPVQGIGATCARSSECAVGLTCIRQSCTDLKWMQCN